MLHVVRPGEASVLRRVAGDPSVKRVRAMDGALQFGIWRRQDVGFGGGSVSTRNQLPSGAMLRC